MGRVETLKPHGYADVMFCRWYLAFYTWRNGRPSRRKSSKTLLFGPKLTDSRVGSSAGAGEQVRKPAGAAWERARDPSGDGDRLASDRV
eukprot:1188101-Prorocentrum_minimum.AAC.1